MNKPTPPRYTMEKDSDFYTVRDTVTNDLLPFKSKVRAEIEQMVERLNSNYNEYIRKNASLR